MIWLASQPRPTISTPAKFGVRGVAGERAPQDLHALALRVHAAAGAVRERDDAVDVREAHAEARRAVKWSAMPRATVAEQFTRGQDADVVARRDAAVGARTMPMNVAGRLDVSRRLGVGAERVVARRTSPIAEVVRVHVLARRDRAAGEADDLVVATHGSPGCAGRDLVAAGMAPAVTMCSSWTVVPGASGRQATMTSSPACRRIAWGPAGRPKRTRVSAIALPCQTPRCGAQRGAINVAGTAGR